MRELNTRAYEIYKYSAKKRNLEFSISLEQLTQLVKGKCYYCDFEPRKYVDGIRNGIDRIDSSIGYTVKNTLSCCSTCNMMKGKLKHDTFLDKIKIIYEENEKYREFDSNKKLAYAIASPRVILEFIKIGLLKEEDIHYDYLESFYLFKSETILLKDTLSKCIRLAKLPVYNFYNKIDRLPNNILSEFYKDLMLEGYVNMRRLVKVLDGNYKNIDVNFKPTVEFRKVIK
jgi:hypothetical protein